MVWDFGDELLEKIKTLPFKSMGPKPKQKRATKRMAADVANEESVAKRTRVDAGAIPAPAPTTHSEEGVDTNPAVE